MEVVIKNFLWMLTIFSRLEFISIFISFLIALFFAYKFSKKKSDVSLENINVGLFGLFWTLACTAQYWILGNNSAVGHSDEQAAGVPWLYYLAKIHDGGSYASSWSGGVDAMIGIVFGTQFFSIERIAFSTLPLFLAILFIKSGAIAIAFFGGYIVARASANLDKCKAILVGMLAGVGNILNIGWALCGNGWGFALLPWIFYVLVLMTRSNYYYISCIAIAFIFSSSTALIHQLPLTFVAVGLGAILFPPTFYFRFFIGCLIFGVVSLLNWYEVIKAVVEFSSISARSTTTPLLQNSILFLIGEKVRTLLDVMVLPIGFFSLTVLYFKKRKVFFRSCFVYIVSISLGFAVGQLDWVKFNAPLLSAYRWELLSYGNNFVILLILVHALTALKWHGTEKLCKPFPLSGIYILLVAVISVSAHTLDDMERYKDLGGQGHFKNTEILNDKSWQDQDIYRVVTISKTLSPNILNAYGFETFDGVSNSFSIRSDLYFGLAVNNPQKVLQNKSYHWIRAPQNGFLKSSANINALRIANIKYIITDLELFDPELQLVTSSSDTDFNPHKIYKIENFWPRIFVPKKIRFSEKYINNQKFYDELLIQNKEEVTVSKIEHDLIDIKEIDVDLCTLRSFTKVIDGYDVQVNCNQNEGVKKGMLVVNTPYIDFWRALSNEKNLKIIPVNGVQMGIFIDKNTKFISLRYERAK